MGKQGVIALGTVLLIAAVVGTVVCLVVIPNRSAGNNKGDVAVSAKTVDAICAATAHPDTCKQALGSISSANASSVISGSVKAAFDAVQTANKRSVDIGGSVTDPHMKMALDDCRQLLQSAFQELQSVMNITSSVSDVLTNHSDDLRVWLSAVHSYQETCLDGLELPELKEQMKTGLGDARELTSVALSVITMLSTDAARALPEALEGFTIGKRRLLTDDKMPDWMVSLDEDERRLLSDDGVPDWLIPKDGDAEEKKKKKSSEKKKKSKKSKGDEPDTADYRIGDYLKPNAVVAQDGSGDYKTINEAVKNIPMVNAKRYVVYVKAGRYNENILLAASNVYMYGDGSKLTVVTGNRHNPVPTFQTATFSVTGTGFVCKDMGFHNTAGPSAGQAVAVRNQADKSVFFKVRMDGFQDTLYAQTHRQFYRNCVISGTIDFIFGNAQAVIQNSLIIVRKTKPGGSNMVTAQGSMMKDDPTAIVIHKCRIVPDRALSPERFKIPTYLGRPWKAYARTIIMESKLGDLIRPEGWATWQGKPEHEKTLFYAEYANTGPGSNTSMRVDWPGYKVITEKKEAVQYSTRAFLEKKGTWLGDSGVPIAEMR